MKKVFFSIGGFFMTAALAIFLVNVAHAATPVLSLSNTGGDNVQVSVNGDANGNVLLFYQKNDGTSHLQYLGATNSGGSYSTTISTGTYGISPNGLVYVTVNSQQSNSVAWPYTAATAGAITLNQTGLVIAVGQSASLIVNNLGNNLLYLLNNSNPQVVNVNINNSQLTIVANTYGQTVMTVCVLGTTSNCASAYITVQNSGASALTFSQSNLTVAYGQTTTISILNSSSGSYSILNNSNPSVIQASLNNSTITLVAGNNNGSASLTVCAADMSACGIINISAGSQNSAALTFSQTSPSLLIGQTLNISISGTGTYNISSNSNTSIVQATISGSNLTLVGGSTGSATITVCSSSGNCGAVTVTVSYATSGPITLSQNNLWLQVGQAISVTISGGTMPYSVLTSSSTDSFVLANLNNNILTLTGVAAGSLTLNVCSAGGACIPLSVLVNGVSSSQQLTFSNNNLTLTAGSSTAVTLYGNGGYYVSSANNQNVATVTVSGNTITINALSAGNANATICQTGGQCGVLYADVISPNSVIKPLVFNPNNPTLNVGQSLTVSVSGGVSTSYYISSNSNPTIVKASLLGNGLLLLGQTSGSSVIVVCAASNNCDSLAVTVSDVASANSAAPIFTSATNAISTGNILTDIATEAGILNAGNPAVLLTYLGATANTAAEQASLTEYKTILGLDDAIGAVEKTMINDFIVYGTPTTKRLGAGERAGVINSYYQAYGKLPNSEAEWSDMIKIANGRWSSESSTSAEAQAKIEFKKVYVRDAVMTNNIDQNAIMVIAYGLLPLQRNLASEKTAIITFRWVYGHDPINALAWNIVRAIAYSGAKR